MTNLEWADVLTKEAIHASKTAKKAVDRGRVLSEIAEKARVRAEKARDDAAGETK